MDRRWPDVDAARAYAAPTAACGSRGKQGAAQGFARRAAGAEGEGTSMIDLARRQQCPFCGHRDTTSVRTRDTLLHDDQYQIICSRCASRGPVRFSALAAARAWNKRTVMMRVNGRRVA